MLVSSASSPISMQDIDLPTPSFSPTVPEFDMSGPAGTYFDRFLLDIAILSSSTQCQVAGPALTFETPIIPQATPTLPQMTPAPVSIAGDNWNQMTMYPESQGQAFELSGHPNFDISLSKPSSAPSPAEIIAQNEAANAKQVKMEQWLAHMEAAKKIEQELTSA